MKLTKKEVGTIISMVCGYSAMKLFDRAARCALDKLEIGKTPARMLGLKTMDYCVFMRTGAVIGATIDSFFKDVDILKTEFYEDENVVNVSDEFEED